MSIQETERKMYRGKNYTRIQCADDIENFDEASKDNPNRKIYAEKCEAKSKHGPRINETEIEVHIKYVFKDNAEEQINRFL